METGEADAYGHRKLGGIGQLLAEEIKSRTKVNIMMLQLAYIMRSGAPDSLDRMVAVSFGNLALDQVAMGHTGRMVALQQGIYTTVPLESDFGPQARRHHRAVRPRQLPPQGARHAGQADVPLLIGEPRSREPATAERGEGSLPSPRKTRDSAILPPPLPDQARAAVVGDLGRLEVTFALHAVDRAVFIAYFSVARRCHVRVEHLMTVVVEVVAGVVVARVVLVAGSAAVDRHLLRRLDSLGPGEEAPAGTPTSMNGP